MTHQISLEHQSKFGSRELAELARAVALCWLKAGADTEEAKSAITLKVVDLYLSGATFPEAIMIVSSSSYATSVTLPQQKKGKRSRALSRNWRHEPGGSA